MWNHPKNSTVINFYQFLLHTSSQEFMSAEFADSVWQPILTTVSASVLSHMDSSCKTNSVPSATFIHHGFATKIPRSVGGCSWRSCSDYFLGHRSGTGSCESALKIANTSKQRLRKLRNPLGLNGVSVRIGLAHLPAIHPPKCFLCFSWGDFVVGRWTESLQVRPKTCACTNKTLSHIHIHIL